MDLFTLLCLVAYSFSQHTVLANSTFFDVPIIPYIVLGGNASNRVIVALQEVNSVPNLVDMSTVPVRPLTSYTSELNAGLHMSAPLVSGDRKTVFAAVSYDDANPSLLAVPPAQYSLIAVQLDGLSVVAVTLASSSASDSASLSLGCALAAAPNSSALLYIKGGSSLFLYDADTGDTSLQLTVAGELSGLQCSPTDSLLVAFSVLRGTSHRLVEVLCMTE